MIVDDFDFGFTTQYKEELVNPKEEEKFKKIHAILMNLLEKLKKNPDKDYIYWPNR